MLTIRTDIKNMSSISKMEKDKQKLIQEKCQTILAQMLRDEDNKYCVDCDAKGMLWNFYCNHMLGSVANKFTFLILC